MSFVSGEYLDYRNAKKVEDGGGLPAYLGKSYGAAEGMYSGFIPGEIAHISPPNAKTQMLIDTPLGKGSGIFFGFLWHMRKKGFHVQKVQEWIEISPVHSQYYQLTIQQKQTLEGQIKTALAGVQTSISDFELLSHDIRRYREYMNYFEAIERGTKEKDADLVRRNSQTLKSIFIDQVDVHTGEGVALKLIASRWPTIIVDFMRISDDDEDPKKTASKYQFSEAEGVVLTTKNKIFKQWRALFKEAVMSRYQHLKELVTARNRSITEYRNMVKPYILRHRMIKEFGETAEGRGVLQSFSWWRPASQAVSLDAAEYWMWRPFWPPEIHRPSLQNFKKDVPVLSMPSFPEPMRNEIKDRFSEVKEAGFEKLETFLTGIEPVDKWVWFLKDEMVKWYRKKYNYRADLDVIDVLNARKKLGEQYAEYGRWDWQPSPYFATLEVPTFRVVVRNPDGTESETFIIGSYPEKPLMAPFDTQNVILLRFLELKLQEKETENYINEMVGESLEGKSMKEVVKEDYPYLHGQKAKKEMKQREAKATIHKLSDLQRSIKFVRPGPYDAIFMERVAAIMLKEIVQSTYSMARSYLKSAVGVP